MFQNHIQIYCAIFCPSFLISKFIRSFKFWNILCRSISSHCFWQWKVLLVNYCKTETDATLQQIRRITFNFSMEKLKKSNWNLRIFRQTLLTGETTVWSMKQWVTFFGIFFLLFTNFFKRFLVYFMLVISNNIDNVKYYLQLQI